MFYLMDSLIADICDKSCFFPNWNLFLTQDEAGKWGQILWRVPLSPIQGGQGMKCGTC